jgi:hypothetical protein
MKSPHYRLAHLASVATQVRDLSKRAAALGIGDWFHDSLNWIVENLQETPMSIGDPVNNPKKKGSVVRVAVVEPVSIRFIVYRHEKVVLWLELKPLSRFFRD